MAEGAYFLSTPPNIAAATNAAIRNRTAAVDTV
jgi:hypothetical protein